jgi:tetratricopeptide (TPR) repeat protein
MRGTLLFCLFALVSCQSADSLARGDRAYRQGHFHQALAAYESAGDPSPGSELAARVTQARFALLVDGARDLLHHDDPQGARRVALAALQQRPNHVGAQNLLERAVGKITQKEIELGEEFLVNEQYPQALATFQRALDWSPENDAAIDGFARAELVYSKEQKKGEAIYFEGLEQLRHEKSLQAFTTLQHATLFLGDSSRAKGQLDKLSREMGEASRNKGLVLLEQGRIGEAWLALWDAERFLPGDANTKEWLSSLEQHIAVEDLLLQAEIALRGGRPNEVRSILTEVEHKAEGAAHNETAPRVQTLNAAADAEQARIDYRLARALEMDLQLVRAQALFAKLSTEQGFHDVVVRQAAIQAVLDRAGSLYAAGSAAQNAEDFSTAKELFAEVLELVIDYKDTAERQSVCLVALLPSTICQ